MLNVLSVTVAKFAAFVVSELLRENQLVEGKNAPLPRRIGLVILVILVNK